MSRFEQIIKLDEEQEEYIENIDDHDFSASICNFCYRHGYGNHSSDCYNRDRRGTLPWLYAQIRYAHNLIAQPNGMKNKLNELLKAIEEETKLEWRENYKRTKKSVSDSELNTCLMNLSKR